MQPLAQAAKIVAGWWGSLCLPQGCKEEHKTAQAFSKPSKKDKEGAELPFESETQLRTWEGNVQAQTPSDNQIFSQQLLSTLRWTM